MSEMTNKDRDTLMQIARQRARVARSSVAQRQAQLLADVEEQLSGVYDAMDSDWHDLAAEGQQAVQQADNALAERCAKRGIPEEFRPRLVSSWFSRGENAIPARRAELRKKAQTAVDAAGKAAKLEIDRAEGEVLVELLSGLLTTEAAHKYLTAMPTPDDLMPALRLAELEAKVSTPRRGIGR